MNKSEEMNKDEDERREVEQVAIDHAKRVLELNKIQISKMIKDENGIYKVDGEGVFSIEIDPKTKKVKNSDENLWGFTRLSK